MRSVQAPFTSSNRQKHLKSFYSLISFHCFGMLSNKKLKVRIIHSADDAVEISVHWTTAARRVFFQKKCILKVLLTRWHRIRFFMTTPFVLISYWIDPMVFHNPLRFNQCYIVSLFQKRPRMSKKQLSLQPCIEARAFGMSGIDC